MKALRSFSVRPVLPPLLEPLERLAMNLRWSWDPPTRDLFRWVDPDAWEASRHDPARLLSEVSRDRLDELANDASFLRYLADVTSGLDAYLTKDRWFQHRAKRSSLAHVAYFSPEFGITEALPQYSGGLGILAGDHLKAASDLGVPLVGIGLFYRNGYFRQRLTFDGWQEESYPPQDPYNMAIRLCEGVRASVELRGERCWMQIWRADVGRTPLYLLDTDVEENSPECRAVTDRLYGGDTEHRLRQEIVLGIGGVRALRALGHETQVFHTNEGHAGFLGLERIRELVTERGLTFDEALQAVRAGTIFTTHTPVPAGIDRFPRELMRTYFAGFADECRISFDTLFALGQRADQPDPPGDQRFNMAVMGLRLSERSNAVSKLHGKVSRQMFSGLWPDVPDDETPIGSITNGVHAPTWVSREIDAVLARNVRPDWDGASEAEWARMLDVRNDELWRAREIGREGLVSLIRERLKATKIAQGLSPSDVQWCDGVLDPEILTIGFARRFATYKRATLLLSQPERLTALLLAPDRPVQFVFAGKAHPADNQGKALIQEIQRFAQRLNLRHRFVYVEDYDIAIARAFYQGCDVWLNTPRRPMEACGTSGEKAALNGALNCSILDGWWDEWFDGENGWAISSAESEHDLARRDEIEGNSLFDLIEHQIVPMFYVRSEGPVPRRWMNRVKHNFASLGPRVTASRMVRDYVIELYEPAAAANDRAALKGYANAKSLAAWKRRVLDAWDGVAITGVASATGIVELGQRRKVTASVQLGSLEPSDVAVQLRHGPVGTADELHDYEVVHLTLDGADADGATTWTGEFTCQVAGRYGYTVCVVPNNDLMASPADLGRITWA